MKKRALLLSASALAILSCGVAQAQTTAPPPDTENGTTIETVVVTAERRTENLMTTAISADVLNGEDLQNKGVVTVDALQFIAPDVTVDNFGQGIDFNIRGIGKGEHNTQTPVGVVTYRDSAATFPGYVTEEPYYDIANVEVYRGPQGTFVGQNATGGAVFVTSNNPVIGGGFDGYAQAQYGNYNDTQVQGAINIPITDTLAMRVALFGDARGSFYSITDSNPLDACPGDKYAGCQKGYNPGDVKWGAGRVSLLWQPAEALTVSVKFDIDYLDNGAYPADAFTDRLPLGAPTPVSGYGASVPNPYHSDLFHITEDAPQEGLDRFSRTIVKADYVFPDGIKLQSVSSYAVANTNYAADLDGTDFGAPFYAAFNGGPGYKPGDGLTFFDRVDETMYSQEINLISPDNQPITWVLGAYAQSDLYGWEPPWQFWISVGPHFSNPTPSPSNFYQAYSWTIQGQTNNLDLAGFGQIEAKLGDGVQVSLGGRWSTTSSKNDVDLYSYGGTPYGTEFTTPAKQQSYNISYKAAIDWAINDGNFLYAFIATGYKGGGLNTNITANFAPPPFLPETVTSYETGWKATDWFDGHMRTEVDAYLNAYNHFQVTIGYPLNPIFGTGVNVPDQTTIYGFEAETQGTFGNLSFDANLGLLHSALGTFWAVDTRLPVLSGAVCNVLTGSGGTNPNCVDLKNHPQTYAPSVTYSLSVQYAFNLDNGDMLTPRLNYGHENGQWATLFDNASWGDRLGVRDLLGAQLEWKTGEWALTLYATNLTDEHYVAAMNSDLDFAGPPRQFGVRLLKVF
jgi:iron complex outermembrane receptor protein